MKTKERKAAKVLYVDQMKTPAEIAAMLDVGKRTVERWITDSGWEAERNAKVNNPTVRTDNIKQILNDLSAERIKLVAEIKGIDEKTDAEKRQQIARIDDAASKWNKSLENVEKQNKISLSVYLSVMESIFNGLLVWDANLHAKTLDYQEAHVEEMSIKLG